MVKQLLLIVLVFGKSANCFYSVLPKDSTTSWCTSQYHYDTRTYKCYSNPLGVQNMTYWWRIPDTNLVNGCLYALLGIPFVLPTTVIPYASATWYEQSDFGGSRVFEGPMVARLSVFVDLSCSDYWEMKGNKPTVRLHPGDSLRIQYKMTPGDTSVVDTIWGEMNAYYIGVEDHWGGGNNPYFEDEGVRSRAKSRAASATWSHGQILLAHPETGPVLVTNLRGQILPTRTRIDGPNTWITPTGPMPPGVYRLRWPKGQSVLVVPMR